MQKQSSQWLIPFFLAAGAALALWYYWAQVSKPEAESQPPESAAEETVDMPGPLHPVAPADSGAAERPDLVPLPPLDQSDEYFKLEIVDIFG
ncbi:MAG: hypothetical protein ABFS30_17610, partial [Pseudomonadota bacterium]